MNNKNRLRKRIFSLIVFMVLLIFIPYLEAEENETVNVTEIINETIGLHATIPGLIDNESQMSEYQNETEAQIETTPFDLDIATNGNNIKENDTFNLAINTTIMGVRIYSLTADAFLITPLGEKIVLNNSNISERTSTLSYSYSNIKQGIYRYDVTLYFEDEEYSVGGSFEVEMNDSLHSQVDINETNNVTHNSSLLHNVSLHDSFLLGNVSLENEINVSLDGSNTSGINNSNTFNTNISTINNSTSDDSDDNEIDVLESNDLLLQEFINESGLNISFILPNTYRYDYGPVLVNGSIDLKDIHTANLQLKIYPEGSPERSTDCFFDIEGSSSFFCELPNSQIEITNYIVRVGLKINDTNSSMPAHEYVFNQFFELKLAEEKKIQLRLENEDFVESGTKQLFTLFAEDSNGFLEDADVGLRIVDPNGDVFTSEATEVSPGEYDLEFHGIIPGVYDAEFFVVKGTRYKSIETQYRILEKDIQVTLDVPKQYNHTYGTLNVSGTLRLTKNDAFYGSDVDIKILTETGLKRGCIVYCDGFCEFTCSLENNIEFTTYNITATLYEDLLEYSDSKEFSVDFARSNITLDVDSADSYYIEEEQIFHIKPFIYDDYILDEGVVYAEITDPDGISYKFSGEEIDDGYMFSFFGITPGRYSANITFIQDGFYATKTVSYIVKNESYYKVAHDERDVVEQKRRQDIKDTLNNKIISDFVAKNETEEYIQLPVTVGEPVRWIKLSKGRKVIFEKRSNNLKDDILTKLVEKHYDFSQKYNITELIDVNVSNVDLEYLETERVRRSEFHLAESKKEVRIISNYNYTDVYADVSLIDIGEAPVDKILLHQVVNNTRIPVHNITYYDDNANGLVDRIKWYIPHMSEQVFEVEVLVDNVSFALESLKTINQYELARFTVAFRNPDVDVLQIYEEGNGCILEVNELQHTMVPDKSSQVFELPYEFTTVGTHKFKIFCGDTVIKSKIEVLPATDIILKRTETSKSYFYDDLHYVSEIRNEPTNFVENGIHKTIDTNFVPQIDTNNSIYFKVDRGLYGVKLRDSDKEYPFTYDFNIASINFSIKGLAFYNYNTMNYTVIYNASTSLQPKRNGNRVVYENIFPNSDLIFTYEPTKFKEELILSDKLILPTPERFGYDKDETYLVLLYEMNLGGLVIDQQVTEDKLFIRTAGFEDLGIVLPQNTYAPLSEPQLIQPMLRIIQKPDAVYRYMTGLPYTTYLRANEPLRIDPTFTIAPTNRDGMSINDQTKTDYYSVSSPYLFVGVNDTEVYKAGLQFTIDLPADATITSAFITVVPGINSSGGTFTSNISIEDSDNTLPYSTGLGNISDRNYWSTKVEWDMNVWNTNFNYSSPDLADLIQHVIDRVGWSSGSNIGFMLDEGNANDAYRSFHDYSSPGTNSAKLTIVYLSSESRPVIELQNPVNDTKTTENTLNFTFTPTDPEGLDVCQLWANFTGFWSLQSTLLNPVNATQNTFENIVVPDGDFIWNIWCNDTMNNYRFNTSDYDLFVDSKEPIITVSHPENESLKTSFETVFNWTVDDVSENLTCNLSYYETISDVSFFENNIFVSSKNVSQYTETNIPVGVYLWNVTCVDLLNNTNVSQTYTFNISRNTILVLSSDVESEMNYTIFQNISFYANYSIANGTPIDDGVCTITFNDTISDTMIYSNPINEYVFSRVFSRPYDYTYDVSCVQTLYDSQTDSGAFYIYPLINASMIKEITRFGINKYNVTLKIKNKLNHSAFVTAHDFVHTAFTPQFYQNPNTTNAVLGSFFGTAYEWEYFMGAGEQKRISYNLTPNRDDFYVHKLYVVGLSSVGE